GPCGPAAPCAPAGPGGPTRPLDGPIHLPVGSTMGVPLIVIEFGVMSPSTLPATIAYGTLWTDARGVISASLPTAVPRKSGVRLSTSLSGLTSPSAAEK